MRQSNKGMMALAAVMALAGSTGGIAPELIGFDIPKYEPIRTNVRHQGKKEMERRARKMGKV